MMSAVLHRLFTRRNFNLLSLQYLSPSLYHRSISSIFTRFSNPTEVPKALIPPPPPSPPTLPLQNPNSRTRTPLEKQFESWVDKLKPGFTPSDIDEALCDQSDPDLALDIFRWTTQQRKYKHNHVTYLTMIKTTVVVKRFGHAEKRR